MFAGRAAGCLELLRLQVAQAGFQRSAGRVPDQGPLLSAAIRHGLGCFRQRQDRVPRWLGQELLPCRPVHQRPRCPRGRAELQPFALEHRQRPLAGQNIASLSATPGPRVRAVDSKDDKQAYTDSYSFTISQQMFWSSRLEIGYVGNRSRDIPTQATAAVWAPTASTSTWYRSAR